MKVGERVHKGKRIGTSGSASGSAHLHFAVEHGNPLDLMASTAEADQVERVAVLDREVQMRRAARAA